jgi:hypothetical protein
MGIPSFVDGLFKKKYINLVSLLLPHSFNSIEFTLRYRIYDILKFEHVSLIL